MASALLAGLPACMSCCRPTGTLCRCRLHHTPPCLLLCLFSPLQLEPGSKEELQHRRNLKHADKADRAFAKEPLAVRLVQEKHLLPPEVHSRLRRACGLPAGGQQGWSDCRGAQACWLACKCGQVVCRHEGLTSRSSPSLFTLPRLSCCCMPSRSHPCPRRQTS